MGGMVATRGVRQLRPQSILSPSETAPVWRMTLRAALVAVVFLAIVTGLAFVVDALV
jgi:hypothetical protein